MRDTAVSWSRRIEMNFPGEVLERFAQAMQVAKAAGEPELTGMSLATTDANGRVSVRTMILKDFDATGFVFYTNTSSTRGKQLFQCPQAALRLVCNFIEVLSKSPEPAFYRSCS